ncbi:MAG: energy transducer TonB [Janthinobacterium lividum]
MLPTNPLLNATTPAGPHLPVGLLRQYAAGTLAPASQHRVEAHTLACPRCADILAGLQQTAAATTDQALAKLQQRLRQRVQQQAAPARYDREERRNRWLIPQLAAAAALLLGLVAGGWWTWQQRHSSAQLATTTAAPVVPAPTTAPLANAVPPVTQAPAAASAPLTEKPTAAARTYTTHRPLARQAAHQQAASQQPALADAAVPQAEPTAPAAEPAALPAPLASTPPLADSQKLAGKAVGLAIAANRAAEVYDAAPKRKAAMPAAPPIAPAPVGGYSALREKLRHEATEFKPEAPEQPLSGTVQLRLTIGADGKIQQIKVLRGLRDDYDQEAQRLVCDGPNWVPGISGGKRAPLDIDIAVPF